MRQHHPHPWIRAAYVICLSAAIIVTVGGVVSAIAGDAILWGVHAGTVAIGGRHPDEATPILADAIASYLRSPIRLVLGERVEHATPQSLGVSIDRDISLQRLMRVGREGQPLDRMITAAVRALFPASIPLAARIDEEKLNAFLRRTFPHDEQPARDAAVTVEDGIVKILPGESGRVIERATLRADLLLSASLLQPRSVALARAADVPAISDNEALATHRRVQELLARAPYDMVVEDVQDSPRTVLTRSDLADAIILTPNRNAGTIEISMDPVRLRELLLSTAAPALNRNPTGIRLRSTSDGATIAQPEQVGIALTVTDQTVARLADAIVKQQSPIALPALTTPPALTAARLAELGVTDYLGGATTNYTGSPRSREHNIAVGAGLYDGRLLAPGEEFSFNTLLGDVGPEQGYLPELVIKNNKTIPEYGGGLCQVSTTAFRAAVTAGLDITRRHAHSYVVRYYGDPGFDATIYPPNPDFRFRNDTPGHLLIQTAVKGSALTFEFYGTNDGRATEIVGPTIYDRQPDGSMKAVVRQVVKRGDEVVREKSFWSSYKPAALYPIIRNPLE